MQVIRIGSLDDPRVADYANMRDAELLQRRDPLDERAHGGVFIAEGELVVRRLAASGFATRSLLTTERQAEKLTDLAGALPEGTPLYVASPEVVNGIVGFNIHRGVLAVGERPARTDAHALLSRAGPFVVLEDLCNHDNLGGVFRNAASLGGAGATVLLSARCADPLYRKSLRVSMGTALSVPFARLGDWPAAGGRDVAALRSAGIRAWAMTPAEDAVDLEEAVSGLGPGDRVALVMGSEGPGLSAEAARSADARVRIPMRRSHASVDSLNVAVAAAIGLYELGRGRG